MPTNAEILRRRRARRNAAGQCSYRPSRLGRCKTMCDVCADMHSRRQRGQIIDERSKPWTEIRRAGRVWEVLLRPRIHCRVLVVIGPFRSESEAEAVARLARWTGATGEGKG